MGSDMSEASTGHLRVFEGVPGVPVISDFLRLYFKSFPLLVCEGLVTR